jgi:hypothetical protein
MKHPTVTALYRPALALALMLFAVSAVMAQNNAQKTAILAVDIRGIGNTYYTCYYKDSKPDDVPQEVYDGLWEIQKEVIDNFTYDYAVLRDNRKFIYMSTKEDFYKYGKGVCENYTNFFILLAREKGLTENLYRVSGSGKRGGHAWLEYRTEKNTYIIDPTWSDDYAYRGQDTQKRYRESPAYGKTAFFITYEEDKVIFRRQGYDHSSFLRERTETPLWKRKTDESSAGD